MKTMIKAIFIGMGFISFPASFCVQNLMQRGKTRSMGFNRPTVMPFGLSGRDKLGMGTNKPLFQQVLGLNKDLKVVAKELTSLCDRNIPTKEERAIRSQHRLHAQRIDDLSQTEERQGKLLETDAQSEISMLNQTRQERVELSEAVSARSQLLASNSELRIQNNRLQDNLKQNQAKFTSQEAVFRQQLQEYKDAQAKIESDLLNKQLEYDALTKEMNELDAKNQQLQTTIDRLETGMLDQANSSRVQKQQLQEALDVLKNEKRALGDQLQNNLKQQARFEQQAGYYQAENAELIRNQNEFERRAFEAEALMREAQDKTNQAYWQARTIFGQSESDMRQALMNEQLAAFETINQAKTVDDLRYEILLQQQAVDRVQGMYANSEADKAELLAKHSSEIQILQKRVNDLIAEQVALDEERNDRLDSARNHKNFLLATVPVDQTNDAQGVRQYKVENRALEAELERAHTHVASMERAMMEMHDHDSDAHVPKALSDISDLVSVPTDFSGATKSRGSGRSKRRNPRVNLAVRVREAIDRARQNAQARAALRKQEQEAQVLVFKRKA